MNSLQACEETRDLWTLIAESLERGKYLHKDEIPGPWSYYRYGCPCCEYVNMINPEPFQLFLNCTHCPMKPEWLSIMVGESLSYYCEDTIYAKWRDGKRSLSCYDLAFFAWLIVELAETAIERIEVAVDDVK